MPKKNGRKKNRKKNIRYTYDISRHMKIWITTESDVFLPIKNQARLIQMREQNPSITIHFVYAQSLLSEDAHAALQHFCRTYQITPFPLENTMKYLSQQYQGKRAFTKTHRTLDHHLFKEVHTLITRKEPLQLAHTYVISICLRVVLAPFLGTYSDFDVEIRIPPKQKGKTPPSPKSALLLPITQVLNERGRFITPYASISVFAVNGPFHHAQSLTDLLALKQHIHAFLNYQNHWHELIHDESTTYESSWRFLSRMIDTTMDNLVTIIDKMTPNESNRYALLYTHVTSANPQFPSVLFEDPSTLYSIVATDIRAQHKAMDASRSDIACCDYYLQRFIGRKFHDIISLLIGSQAWGNILFSLDKRHNLHSKISMSDKAAMAEKSKKMSFFSLGYAHPIASELLGVPNAMVTAHDTIESRSAPDDRSWQSLFQSKKLHVVEQPLATAAATASASSTVKPTLPSTDHGKSKPTPSAAFAPHRPQPSQATSSASAEKETESIMAQVAKMNLKRN